MKVIHRFNQIKKFKKPVVALGVFDGVHLGHRQILKEVVAKAKLIKGTSIVLTFWPHPQKEETLYSLGHRLKLIGELGIDVCIVISFNQRFAEISAVDFVKDILYKKIHTYYICVGRNFVFGKGREGDFKILRKLSKIYNFKLKVFAVVKNKNIPISSTDIRTLIKKGDLPAAEKLLSRPVSILGTVIKGASLARKLGFPTANINPHHEVVPPSGIYAVKVIFNKKKFNGTCYIGTKPTFVRKQKDKYIEVYIFGLKKNLYGKNLEIQFVKKIRNEKRFSSLQHLTSQIKKDILSTQRLSSLH